MKEKKPCSVEGCTGKVAVRGWCPTHYDQWRRTRPGVSRCSVEGCSQPVRARGYCATHYERWRSGKTLVRVPLPTVCTRDDCNRPYYARGWCNMHYRRWQKGTPQDAPRGNGGRPPRPETRRALEVLADGEWHDYSRLIVAMTKVIAPNTAAAHMQLFPASAMNRRKKREAEGRTRESRRRLHTQEQVLRSARRDLSWRALYGLWRQGRIEIDPPPVRGRGDEHYSAIKNRKVRLRRESAEVDPGDA